MIKRKFVFIVLLLFLSACATKTPESSAPRLPTAIVVTAGQPVPPTSTVEVSVSDPTALPVSKVADSAAEFQIRVQISTTSDWTNLEILNPQIVRDAKITAETGTFTNRTAAPDFIAMNQLLENAFAGKAIMLQVDLWINATARADKLDMTLQKGDIGLATLRFYRPSDGGDVLIQEISHDVPEGGPTGLNELSFSIYLNK